MLRHQIWLPRSFLPKEYIESGNPTPEVDYFCFGIFIFELISGLYPSVKVSGVKTMRDKMLANQHLDETLIDQGPVTEGWALVVPDYFEKYNLLFDCSQLCWKTCARYCLVFKLQSVLVDSYPVFYVRSCYSHWLLGNSLFKYDWDLNVTGQLKAVWPDWVIYWILGNFSKPVATISLPKSLRQFFVKV